MNCKVNYKYLNIKQFSNINETYILYKNIYFSDIYKPTNILKQVKQEFPDLWIHDIFII